MLVISRKRGEKIHIGRDITISVVDIRAGKVRIGIEAPEECQVIRSTTSKDNPMAADIAKGDSRKM